MRERLFHMLRKEFLQVFRDPKMLRVIFVVPVVQLLVFGYAATTDIRRVATAVIDRDNSVTSRELLARFVESGTFRIVEWPETERQAAGLLDRGTVQAVLCLPAGLAQDVAAGRPAAVQLLVDGTDSLTAGQLLDHASRITARLAEDLARARLARQRGAVVPPGRVELLVRAWFNENLESRYFYVPGVMAILVMLITLLLTSMAVVREKEVGTMEQVLVTPITPAEFILGKTLPFALIGMADVLLVTAVGVFWFHIPIRGSLLLLLGAAVLYLMTALGIGLLISTVSDTQQQAMMSTFFFFFPAVLLSGFMFPIANMPEPIQWLTLLNPLRYFLVIVRGIFLKGVGPDVLGPSLLALAIMGVFTLAVAVRRFRKTLA